MAVKSYNILGMFSLLDKNAIFTQIEHSISVGRDLLYELLTDIEDICTYLFDNPS
jgi:hypothetical protein